MDIAEEVLVPGDKCPLSGVVVTAIPHDDWIWDRPYRCHLCGALTTYRTRNTDYAGQARLHTHKIPIPVTNGENP